MQEVLVKTALKVFFKINLYYSMPENKQVIFKRVT